MNRFLLSRIANQISSGRGSSRTPRLGLGQQVFSDAGRKLVALEQNPSKNSRWGELARQGHSVVQVKDVTTGKYTAVVVDGKVIDYEQQRR